MIIMEDKKIQRIKLILEGICPECKGELLLSDSKESSTCSKCNASYDLTAIRLSMRK